MAGHFPYEYIYRRRYRYMVELKRALDAKGRYVSPDALYVLPSSQLLWHITL
jgi:hypothetical protein